MPLTEERQIHTNIDNYISAIITNVDNRFPTSSVNVLDAFSILNVEQLAPDPESMLFQFYGDKEIDDLKNHLFQSDLQDQEKLLSTEWVLCQVLGQFQEEFSHVVATATERGGRAIKRIKARSQSEMKNDMLEALMMISMNGPTPNSELANKLIRKVAVRFESSR
ncbi:Hypothetical predicted protein [Paramuricea clavata]|uniref:Uncharacterized protein n=1 Tax=Paramuricea clavata TaxID=317549 RepID=A0A6S7HFD2_PARCT|nr:Hypothetical predicted protein [Paramuricea clavata]